MIELKIFGLTVEPDPKGGFEASVSPRIRLYGHISEVLGKPTCIISMRSPREDYSVDVWIMGCGDDWAEAERELARRAAHAMHGLRSFTDELTRLHHEARG